MSTKKKRDKKYRPRAVLQNPVDWAIAGVHTFPTETQHELLADPLAALEHFADGAGTRDDWNSLVQSVALAEELALAGIGPNLMPEIVSGQKALDAIAERLKDGGAQLGAANLDQARDVLAVREAITIYEAQLQLCSQAEYGRAVKNLRAIMESAMAFHARHYDAMPDAREQPQLELVGGAA